MSKFNTGKRSAQPPVAMTASAMRTVGGPGSTPDTRTFEGGPGWTRDTKTDLFLRATSSFHGGEKSFYEDAEKRDDTLVQLVHQLAVTDPQWVLDFATWLRGPGNIRTAALMIAAEFVKARLDEENRLGMIPGPAAVTLRGDAGLNRRIINAVCQRADEPGELLAYWTAKFSRRVPKPVKRGLADAARRLYNERSLLKYDTNSHAFRFADVLELCHPRPHSDKLSWQGDLFKHAIDRRHGRPDIGIPLTLPTLRANEEFRYLTNDVHNSPKGLKDAAVRRLLDHEFAKSAGVTWEDVLSALGSKVDKAKLWEAIIPSMGYMALLRNLRNFDEAGISNTAVRQVLGKLEDPDQVLKSRQLPFRFYSAYKSAPNLRWAPGLQSALDICLPNIPALPGRTLTLIDTSASMRNPMSGKSTMQCVEAAALFGAALALKTPTDIDLVQFATNTAAFTVPKGGSTLKLTETVMNAVGQVGHGTEMAGAIRERYNNHDRVILLSDMQAFGSRYGYQSAVGSNVPNNVPIYCFNLSAYSATPMPTGEAARFDLGGLTDATFALIPRLEAGVSGDWSAIFGMK